MKNKSMFKILYLFLLVSGMLFLFSSCYVGSWYTNTSLPKNQNEYLLQNKGTYVFYHIGQKEDSTLYLYFCSEKAILSINDLTFTNVKGDTIPITRIFCKIYGDTIDIKADELWRIEKEMKFFFKEGGISFSVGFETGLKSSKPIYVSFDVNVNDKRYKFDRLKYRKKIWWCYKKYAILTYNDYPIFILN